MKKAHNILVKPSSSLYVTGALALVLAASVAQASVTITGNYLGATAPIIDSSYGNLEFALSYVSTTRDGIVFTPPSAPLTGSSYTFLSNGGLNSAIDVVGTTSGGDWGVATLGGGTDALFHTVGYVEENGSYTIDLTDLDASKSYQLQFLFGDPRTGFAYDQIVTFSDNIGSTTTANLKFGSDAAGDEFAILTAVVSGTTSLKFTTPGASLISGLAVHSIPEPSAALLGGLGLLALLRRRRA